MVDLLYIATVLILAGASFWLFRKINELGIALDLHSVGDRLGVVQTELATLGLAIWVDNFSNSLAIGQILARMEGAGHPVAVCLGRGRKT